MKNIRYPILNNILWSLIGRYIPSFIQIISTLVIARLVEPRDFGEIAIVMTFVQISSLIVSSGFAEALIYNVNNSKTLYSTVFYLNIIISIVVYCILFLLSPYIASFYAMDRLTLLIKVIGLNIIIFSFIYIHKGVLYVINLNFKTPSIIFFISSAIGSILGITLAFKGFGVWALVFQTLSINFFQLILFWFVSDWKPLFSFSFKELKSIISYSSKIFLNNITQVLFDNLHVFVIGKVFAARILGYYNRMQTIAYYTTTNFVYAIESVFYPILCVRKENQEHLINAYEIILRLSTYVAFPVLGFMICLGRPLILLILTEKWIDALPILRLISVAYLFVPIIFINNSFLKILNKPHIIFNTGLVKKIIGVILLFITLRGGILYVCYGIIAYFFIDAVISMLCIQFFLKVSIYKQISSLFFNVILNAFFLLIIYFTSFLFSNNLMKIFVSIFGWVFYLLMPFLFKAKESLLLKRLALSIKLCKR